MLTREEYKSYIDQIMTMEQKMRDLFASVLEEASDPEVLKVFSGLMKSEQGHMNLLAEIANAE